MEFDYYRLLDTFKDKQSSWELYLDAKKRFNKYDEIVNFCFEEYNKKAAAYERLLKHILDKLEHTDKL